MRISAYFSCVVSPKVCIICCPMPPRPHFSSYTKGRPMGSAALRDDIQGIIDWGETVGGVSGGLPKATEAFGSLTFNDEAQKARLPKTAYAALRQTIVHGHPLEPGGAHLLAG